MAQFLSADHMAAATEAMNADPGFRNAMTNTELTLQFAVQDTPEGDVPYYLVISDGSARMERGEAADADASVTSDYETAKAMVEGDLNVQMAFMTGKIKIGGNMAKIMMNQGLINEFVRVQSGLDIEV